MLARLIWGRRGGWEVISHSAGAVSQLPVSQLPVSQRVLTGKQERRVFERFHNVCSGSDWCPESELLAILVLTTCVRSLMIMQRE